jgi:hypothetical protein
MKMKDRGIWCIVRVCYFEEDDGWRLIGSWSVEENKDDSIWSHKASFAGLIDVDLLGVKDWLSVYILKETQVFKT